MCSSDNPGYRRLSQGHFSLDEVNAAKRIKEKQDAEERALNETAQEKKGKEKADKRTLNESPANATKDVTKDATTQKHPRRRRKPAKISLRPRVRGRGSGYAVSWTPSPPLPGALGGVLR